MFTTGGCTTGELQTTVETNHWPQRPTWVTSSNEEEEEQLMYVAKSACALRLSGRSHVRVLIDIN